jgi:hypothetical protein
MTRFYVFFFFLLLGNGTREFFDKTLYINSSSLHHRTTNEPSSSHSSMATLSHLNINKSHDEKIVPNFKSTENQGESIKKKSQPI